MSLSIEVKPDAGMQALIERRGGWLRTAIRDGLNQIGQGAEATIKRRLRENRSVKSGGFLNRIGFRMFGDLEVRAGVAVADGGALPPQAAQLEFGGPIPKAGPMPRGKFLVWPADGHGAVTPSGVSGFNARDLRGAGYRPRFIFAKRVFQKGKPYIAPSAAEIEKNAPKDMGLAIDAAIERLGRGAT